MELYDQLRELYEAVQDSEIFFDSCEHAEPSRPGVESGEDFCPVCFIVNLFLNCSDSDPEFSEETTDKQRETIESLWEEWLN